MEFIFKVSMGKAYWVIGAEIVPMDQVVQVWYMLIDKDEDMDNQ